MSIAFIVAAAACRIERPRAHTLAIRDFLFTPTDLTVSAGDTVVWTNADFVPHTATGTDSAWDSKTISANSSWRFVARVPGRHEYYCAFHPNMRATVTVR